MTPVDFLIYLSSGLITFAIAVIVHELGHFLYLKYALKENVKIQLKENEKGNGFYLCVGEEHNYIHHTKQELTKIYFFGVISGYFVIGLAAVLFSPFYLILIPFYLWGCKDDFKQMWRLHYGYKQ